MRGLAAGAARLARAECQLTSQVARNGVSTSTQDAFTAGLSLIGRRGTPAFGEGTSAAFLAPPVLLAGVGASGLDAITVSLQHQNQPPEASLSA